MFKRLFLVAAFTISPAYAQYYPYYPYSTPAPAAPAPVISYPAQSWPTPMSGPVIAPAAPIAPALPAPTGNPCSPVYYRY